MDRIDNSLEAVSNTSTLLSQPAQVFVKEQTELAAPDAQGQDVGCSCLVEPFLFPNNHVLQLTLPLCGGSRTEGLFRGEELHVVLTLLDPFSSSKYLSILLSETSFTCTYCLQAGCCKTSVDSVSWKNQNRQFFP